MTRPVIFDWNGEAMIPRHPKVADREYTVGERYALVPYEARSITSHNHEFAWLAEAWQNLPEQYADLYPTPEHLRKRALIEAGFYDETAVDAGTLAAAIRVAAAFRAKDEFALVIVRGPLVLIRTAKSQSRRAMDRETFQRSKTAIMEIISLMIGVKIPELAEASAA